jgi:hypothetical protein
MLQWAREHGCQWDSWTCNFAAAGGNLETLQWVWEHGCPWQDLTPLNFSAQPEPFMLLKHTKTTQRVPQKVITLSRKVDKCTPLARGTSGRVKDVPCTIPRRWHGCGLSRHTLTTERTVCKVGSYRLTTPRKTMRHITQTHHIPSR